VLASLFFLWFDSTGSAQDADALLRIQDRKLASREEREQALNSILNSAREAREAEQWTTAATFLNRAGRLQIWLHQQDAALTTFDEVRQLLSSSPKSPAYIDSLNGTATVYIDKSKCADALKFIEQAQALNHDNGHVAAEAETLLLLSDCQNYSEPDLAINTAQTSLALWQSVNDRLGMARAYEAIGHYQLAQTRLPEATASHNESLKIFKELNIVSEQAEALINLGFIEYRQGAWDDCLNLLSQAQGMIEERAEPFKMGQIVGTLGEAFLENGLPEVALEKFELSIEYFRESKQDRAVSVMLWDLGKAYYALGNYPQALIHLQQALTDAQAADDRALEAFSNEYLGRTYSAMDNSEAALRHLQSATRIYGTMAKTMEGARTGALIGQEYLQHGQIEPAKKELHAALATFQKLSDHINSSATLYALGKLELRQKNLDVAEDYLRRSIEVTENIRRISTSNDLTAAFSAAVDDRYQSYVECLMLQHQAQPVKGYDVRAFEAAEASRGRALVEMLRRTGGNFAPGVDAGLVDNEKTLRKSLRVKEDQKVTLLAGSYKQEDLTALDAEIADLEKKHDQAVTTIQASYPVFKQVSHPQSWSLRQIQEQVVANDQTLLLEFSLGESQSFVWAITHDSLKSYPLPPESKISEQAERLYKALATQPGDVDTREAVSAATQDLAKTILAPVIAELNKQRLIIVAQGALNYVPFQLLTSPRDGQPLIATYDVVNAPSASILASLREERPRPAGKLLAAFGSPVFQSNYSAKALNSNVDIASLQSVAHDRWQQAVRDIELNADTFNPALIKPLLYSGRELASLREVVGDSQSTIAADFEASINNLFKTDLTQYAVLHFATHGFLDPKRPENSGLVLSTITPEGKAQNGFLALKDIYQLRAPVDLVVLSACQTGLGKNVRGEGVIGLTRGFMYAGAASVVASLWKVDDEATAELMKLFYQNMFEKGMTPAAALREAQNEFRHHPVWNAPYYWAGFTLQGDYRQVVTPTRNSRRYAILFSVGIIILLSATALWYFRRRTRRSVKT
jgi:CHAT domain-containing protein